MNPIVTLLIFVLMLLPGPGSASGFEFCDFDGTIQSAAAAGRKRTYDIDLMIADAKRAHRTRNGDLSYTDCAEYIAQPMQIQLKLPRRTVPPAAGDRLRFSRSAVDVFNADGSYAGTDVITKLLKYHRADDDRRAARRDARRRRAEATHPLAQ